MFDLVNLKQTNMKAKITLLALVLTALIACSKDDAESNSSFENFTIPLPGQVDDGISGTGEDELYADDLIAGQNNDAGSITVTVVDGYVVVTYQTEDDWVIDDITHLYIGAFEDLPTTNSGNPKVGQFPYNATHAAGTTTVTVIGPEIAVGECVYIAAHAEVTNTANGQHETAWGNGTPIGGNSWAMGFEVCY
jgi:hypothetical protein